MRCIKSDTTVDILLSSEHGLFLMDGFTSFNGFTLQKVDNSFKGTVRPKLKIQSLFAHPHADGWRDDE